MKTLVVGEDIQVIMRFSGTFSEPMELEEFPFDTQGLTISLAFNCRTTGMMPLAIVCSPALKADFAEHAFAEAKSWRLHPRIKVTPDTKGIDADHIFPCVDIQAHVSRRANFVMLNVALPVFLFTPMAMLQFVAPPSEASNRLSISLTLVLTSVAHRLAMTTLVPQISYMTCARAPTGLIRSRAHGVSARCTADPECMAMTLAVVTWDPAHGVDARCAARLPQFSTSIWSRT